MINYNINVPLLGTLYINFFLKQIINKKLQYFFVDDTAAIVYSILCI